MELLTVNLILNPGTLKLKSVNSPLNRKALDLLNPARPHEISGVKELRSSVRKAVHRPRCSPPVRMLSQRAV